MTPFPGVAATVRAELARRGRTQHAAALRLGISTSAMSVRLCGRKDFTVTEIRSLADWLDVPISVLMDEPGALERTEAPPHQCAPAQALSA